MKNKFIIFIAGLSVIGLMFLLAGNNGGPTDNKNISIKSQNSSTTVPAAILAEKIEVVHFHATQQCWACITLGKYALKTIQEKFPEEYQKGTIVFKDINGELPENKDIVIKYQARGSSLFVNAIVSGKDNIEEDVNVWRLVANESQFVNYFQNKINKLLKK